MLRLIDRPSGAVLYRRPAEPVDSPAFLRAANGLARRLPAGGPVLNACRDRFRFAVTLAAAIIAGRTSLLCGDPSASTLLTLRERFPDAVLIDDSGADGPDGADGNPAFPADRLVAIVLTSGSTGAPVAHEKRWGELVARSRAAGLRFGLTETAPSAVVGTVPPGHMYGLETTVLLPWHAAASTWCGPAFFPADVAAALEAVPAPRTLVTTPLQLRSLRDLPPPFPALCISATAPLDRAVATEVEAAWSSPVLEIFGATECGSVATRRTAADDLWLPYDGVTLRQGPDGPIVSAPGSPGVVLADEIALEPGGFRLLGRRTDVVKLGGRRASLAGLNRELMSLRGVVDGAFVVPDDLEQRPTARLLALVVAPGRTGPDLLAELRERIDPVFLPRRILCVPALPRNTLGKLPRQAVLDALRDA